MKDVRKHNPEYLQLWKVASRYFSQNNSSSSENNSKKNSKEDQKNEPPGWLGFVVAIGILLIIELTKKLPPNPKKAAEDEEYLFHDLIMKGEVVSIQPIGEEMNRLEVTLHPGAMFKGRKVRDPEECKVHLLINSRFSKFEERLHEVENKLGIPVKDRIEILKPKARVEDRPLWYRVIDNIANILIVMLVLNQLKRNTNVGGIMNKFKFTTSEEIRNTSNAILFKDVAGLHAPKQEVMEFMEYLRNPLKYQELGAKLPHGALLLGPPGCGKTLLVKALAAEANVPFVSMAGSEFIEVIGGLGARRIRTLFEDARQRAPCIIFIDEIDAIGRRRSASADGGGSEREQTLNQLLVEMDGMGTKVGTVVFAATNRSDVLDPALLRPGRFDRHIYISLPDKIERREIFEMYLGKYRVSPTALLLRDYLADLTPGMSGADIANICNEAALNAAKNLQDEVEEKDFDAAIEKVIAGAAKKSRILTENERRIVATHEAGHALVGWLLKHSDKLLKVSIVPRTNAALGFAQITPSDRMLTSKEELLDKMAVLLGGRIAEAVVFNRVSSGAQDDLRKVTDIAYQQVRTFGFSPVIGHLSFNLSDEDKLTGNRPYSQWMTRVMDEEAHKLITIAYNFAEKILRENKESLIKISEALLQKETLNYKDLVQLIGPPAYDK